ncbi:MAG: TonB family protein [bacterium]|nr:TonB family protein [bacterium]
MEMFQKRTFDISLMLSITIHSVVALILSFIAISRELPTPPEIIEVEVIGIKEQAKIPKFPFEKEKTGMITKSGRIGQKVEVLSAHPIVSYRKGKEIRSILGKRGIERDLELYSETKDLVEIGSGMGDDIIFKEESISEGSGKKIYEEEEGLVRRSLGSHLFGESLVPGAEKEGWELERSTPFRMEITGPTSTRKILYMKKFSLPNWVEEKGISLQGRLRFLVTPNGEVFNVEVLNSFGYPEIDRLASRMLRNWRFEKLQDEENVQWGIVDVKIQLK